MNSEIDQTIRYFSPKEFASIIGVSTSTLRRWEKEGFVTSLRTPEGERSYTSDMIERYQKQKEYQAYLKSQSSKQRTARDVTNTPRPLSHSIIENWHKIGFVMFGFSLLFTLIAFANMLKNSPLENSSWLYPLQSVLAAFDSRVPQFNSLFSVGTPARPVRADTDPDSTPTPTVPPSPYSGITLTALRDLYTDLVARFDALTAQNPMTNYQDTNSGSSPTPTPITDITSFPHRSHSSLTNLTNSDDHTQYLYGSGRAGGQTLVGGIDANDILTLQSSTATTGTGSEEKALKIIVGSGGETEALTILNNGNIGFQKTNPGFTLDVGGIVNATALYVNGTPYIGSQWTTTSSNIFYTTGNVGIGTSTPTTSLDIGGTLKTTGLTFPTGAVAGYVLTTDADGVASWTDVSSSAGPWGLTGNNLYPDSTSNNLAIGATDAGSAKLYVNGNVGIGTTAPAYALDIVGQTRISNLTSSSSDTVLTSNAGVLESRAIDTRTWGSTLLDGSSLTTNYLTKVSDANTLMNSLVFDNGTNVGIGTTSPGAKIHVYDGGIRIDGAAIGSGGIVNYAGVEPYPRFTFNNKGDFNWGPGNAAVDTNLYRSAANVLRTSDSFVIDGTITVSGAGSSSIAGNVGIGTTSPTDKLNIHDGSLVFTGNDTAMTGPGVGLQNNILWVTGGTGGLQLSDDSYSGTNGIFIKDGGNVGIGTTSPQEGLELSWGKKILINGGSLKFGTSTSNPMIDFGADVGASVDLGFRRNADSAVIAKITGTGGAYFAGNVGIGTTSPGQKLSVEGNVGIANGSYLYLRTDDTTHSIRHGGGTANDAMSFNTWNEYVFNNGGSGRFLIPAGNVGIGTTSPGYKLDVDGTIRGSMYLYLKDGGENRFQIQSNGGTNYINNNYYNSLIFQNTGNELARYNASGWYFTSGNVGIGTTTPLARFGLVGADSLNTSFAANIGGSTGTGLVVTNSGNVGIGTTSPGAPIHVGSDSSSIPGLLVGAGGSTTNYISVSGGRAMYGEDGPNNRLALSAGTSKGISFYVNGTNGTYLAGSRVLDVDYLGNFNFSTTSNGSFLVNTNQFYIQSITGNVGIGTTSPTSMLSVGASSQFQVNSTGNIVKLNNVTTSFPSAQGAANSILRNDGAGTLTWADPTGTGVMGYWQRNGTSVAPTTITDSLGIGTTAPAGKFDITDTSNTLASLNLTNNTATTIGAGLNTAGVLDLQSTSLSTGNFLNMEVNGLTSGKGLNLTSNSTVLSTGNLASIDWSPSGSTEIFATGDLFKINTGTYANIGNLFALYDDGSELFSVDQSKITNSLPTEFTSPGDVSMAYDLQFTNASTANIKSDGPLTISSGEVFGSNNLTLKTYNQGSVLVDYADSGTTANNHTALQLSPAISGAISTGTRNIFGLYNNPMSTAANSGGTSNLYGSYIIPSSTLATAGATNVYGSYISGTATHAADAGTVNQYGLYIANGTSSTNGTSTKYGLYVEAPTGADTNVAGYFGGNVGIGTTSPGAKLSIADASGTFNIDSWKGYIDSSTNTLFTLDRGNTSSYGYLDLRTAGASKAAIGLASDGTDNLYFGIGAGLDSSTTKMVITTAGNVGIGTTSPSHGLELYGTADAGSIKLVRSDYSPELKFFNGSSGSDGEPIGRIQFNGKVSGGTDTLLADIWGYQDGASFNNGRLLFRTSNVGGTPTERLRIDGNGNLNFNSGKVYFDGTSGNVGIGTTSPGARLAINSGSSNLNTQISGSDIYFTRSSDAGVAGGIVFDGTNELKFRSWAADGRIVFNDASGETVRITAGKVGIGTTAPTYSLDVKSTGTDIARFTGTNSTGCTLSDGGVIACSSDRNLKKNIVDTNLGLDAVMNLRPVEFNWNFQQDGDRKSLGFIAQEVEQIAPSLVTTDSNGYKQLNSIGLIPLVAKAIQEQQGLLRQASRNIGTLQDDIGAIKATTLSLTDLTTKVNAWDAIIIPLQTIVKEIQDLFITLQTQLGLVRADVDTTKDQVASLSASLNSMNVDYTSWKEAIASGSGVLGASNSALLDKLATASSLLVKDDLEVGGKTTTFDLTVLNKLTSGVIEIGAGVAGDEINSAGGIRFQTLSQGPIDFMNGKVVIDVDGSITAKHLKLDTTDFTSSTAGTSVLKAGKTTIQVDTTSITSDSLVFITPITLTDIPIAVTQKSTSIGFTVTIPQTISKDLEFQWLVIN